MMKLFIVLSVVVIAASALPTPQQTVPVEIGADNLLLGNSSRTYELRNAGLTGFGHRAIGGAGGASWTVWDAFALRDSMNNIQPRMIYVRGRIDLTPLFTGSPGVVLAVGPYKSIIGGDSNAEIFGGGLQMVNQVHVIIQNVKFTNAINYAPGEQPNGQGGIISQVPGAFGVFDNLIIRQSEHIWVDHCEFSDDPFNAAAIPADRRRHNGLLTIRSAASHISISNSIFRNHNMNMLIGVDDSNTEDIGRLKTTLYLNWFQAMQRNPLVRYGEVHVLNNLYTNIQSYGIGVFTGARIYGERNAFINTARAWAHPVHNQPASGIGFFNFNNILVNSGFDANIPATVNWNPNQHYVYNPMAAANVEAHVRRFAGTW